MKLLTVNYHLYKPCNLKCRFCFATFRDVRGQLTSCDSRKLLYFLAAAGAEKINFAGGEPTLHPGIAELVIAAKQLGMTTSIVTNGYRLEALLREAGSHLDWVGLSVDSAREDV